MNPSRAGASMFHLTDLSLLGWIAAAISAILIGIAKTGVPGVGIVAVPLMAAVIPAKTSTGAILPMLIMADCCAVALYRRHARWGHLARLIPWALAGIVLGFFAMDHITNRQLQPIIGAIVLGLFALSWWRDRRPDRPIPSAWWFAASMGLLGGCLTMMANAAGPIMILYLLAMRLPKHEFMGTSAWYFLIVNVLKLPFSRGLGVLTGQTLLLNLTLAPLVLLGALGGAFILRRLPERLFAQLAQALAILAALKLLFG